MRTPWRRFARFLAILAIGKPISAHRCGYCMPCPAGIDIPAVMPAGCPDRPALLGLPRSGGEELRSDPGAQGRHLHPVRRLRGEVHPETANHRGDGVLRTRFWRGVKRSHQWGIQILPRRFITRSTISSTKSRDTGDGAAQPQSASSPGIPGVQSGCPWVTRRSE